MIAAATELQRQWGSSESQRNLRIKPCLPHVKGTMAPSLKLTHFKHLTCQRPALAEKSVCLCGIRGISGSAGSLVGANVTVMPRECHHL